MSSWLLWMILSRLTGSPIGSAILLLVFYFVFDRYTFGVLPDPFRFISKWRRRAWLRNQLAQNPHDGRVRLELAGLLVDAKNGKEAVEILRPNFDRGADDAVSVFTMGEACLMAGYAEQGEKLLDHAEELDPNFRVGEINLVRGRYRLQRGDHAGAKKALEGLLKQRSGSVQGRVLLARAQRGLGDDASAALLDDEAWKEYAISPRFQKRQERFWAWRANPSRPATYAFIIVLAVFFFGAVVAPRIEAYVKGRSADGTYYDPGLNEPDE
ncbi:MAG: hypothetical protein QM817_21940 [Archangium sp.]